MKRTKHFSALVDLGARVVEWGGSHTDQIAFMNPDGSLVVELLNAEQSPRAVEVAVRGQRHRVELPPESVGTLLLPAA